jgi:hypothetical protein
MNVPPTAIATSIMNGSICFIASSLHEPHPRPAALSRGPQLFAPSNAQSDDEHDSARANPGGEGADGAQNHFAFPLWLDGPYWFVFRAEFFRAVVGEQETA